jgi:hypothetical protein
MYPQSIFLRLTAGFVITVGWICATQTAYAAGFCTQTAEDMLQACNASVEDDGLVGKAICTNITNNGARNACLKDLSASQTEASTLCGGQHDARLAACTLLGESRYDPDIRPVLFDDPLHPSNPNPYFPIGVGKHWEYRSATEVNTVDVLNETKLIAGVTCIVFLDQVFVDGVRTESTNDWFAAAKDGAVWYFGEATGEYEVFKGDNPPLPQLVNIDGSFKAGVDDAKPGIIALAAPQVGNAYLEEFSLGNAEDTTQILSTTYSYGNDAVLDEGVPPALAQRFCNHNCIVTKNFSQLEPGVFSHKYYARGVGVILEVEEGDVSQLVNCNFDKRCVNLPLP